MAISCPRIYYRILYSITCMVIYVFILFCASLTIEDQPLQHKNYTLQDQNSFSIQYDRNISFTNQSLASSLTYQIETTEFYPYLPIQIYTKNRERFFQLKNRSKKI